VDKFKSVEGSGDVSLSLVADVLLLEPIFAGVATPAAIFDLMLDCLNAGRSLGFALDPAGILIST